MKRFNFFLSSLLIGLTFTVFAQEEAEDSEETIEAPKEDSSEAKD